MNVLPKPYYSRNGIEIYCGEASELLKDLDQLVNCVITDPPYSEQTHSGARTLLRSEKKGPNKLVHFDSMPEEQVKLNFDLAAQWLTKGWFLSTIDYHMIPKLEADPPKGLRFVRFGIWHKLNGAPQFTGDRPAQGWEAVAILHTLGGKMRWNGGGFSAVWPHNIEQGNHPTQKPLGLVKTWVSLFSNAGDLILDPFMGSGTTLVAAQALKRRAIGIEISEDYCAKAVERLRQESFDFDL